MDWDKPTSGFGKRTVIILEFYFRFRFSPNFRYRLSLCIGLSNFVKIEIPSVDLWRRHVYFFKIAAGSHIGFDLGNNRPPTLSLALEFDLNLILEIWRFLFFAAFWFEIAYFRPFWVLGHISPEIWRPIILTPKSTILERKHVIWAIKLEDHKAVRPGRRIDKKVRTVTKSHNMVIFRLFGENSPHCTDWNQNSRG